jgi:hypothetical protein
VEAGGSGSGSGTVVWVESGGDGDAVSVEAAATVAVVAEADDVVVIALCGLDAVLPWLPRGRMLLRGVEVRVEVVRAVAERGVWLGPR